MTVILIAVAVVVLALAVQVIEAHCLSARAEITTFDPNRRKPA